jgi:hypothetical protein
MQHAERVKRRGRNLLTVATHLDSLCWKNEWNTATMHVCRLLAVITNDVGTSSSV